MQSEKLNNIYKLKYSEIVDVLDTCIDALGLVDIQEAKTALGVSRGRIYQLMNESNTKQIGIHKFPMINLINKQNERI